MTGPVRAVVFDLDGLMFDTEALFFRSASAALEARGKRFTPELMRGMIGRRSGEAVHLLEELVGPDETVEVLLADVRRRFEAALDTDVGPMPGLLALLDRLEAAGLPLAVATSSRRAFADRMLGRHGLRDRFAFLLTAEDVTQGKPHPEIYERAAERFGVPAPSMLVLEDSPAGVAAAVAAGAVAVAVPHDHSPAEGLAHAALIVPRLDDPAVLDRIGLEPPRPRQEAP